MCICMCACMCTCTTGMWVPSEARGCQITWNWSSKPPDPWFPGRAARISIAEPSLQPVGSSFTETATLLSTTATPVYNLPFWRILVSLSFLFSLCFPLHFPPPPPQIVIVMDA